MFKLVLLLFFFVFFIVNFFYTYINVVPYFKFETRFNIYQYFLDTFQWTETGFINEVFSKKAKSDSGYLLDITGFIWEAPFDYLISGNHFTFFVPVFILRTGDINLVVNSGDILFDSLSYSGLYNLVYQEISSGNNYIYLSRDIDTWGVYEFNRLFLNKFYIYCALDNYQYWRYYNRNKDSNDKDETITDKYLCIDDKTATYGFGRWFGWWYICRCDKAEDIYDYDFSPYKYLCESILPPGCDTNGCIRFITGTIDLTSTKCNLNDFLGDRKNFKIR
jgi:hypothetical protein